MAQETVIDLKASPSKEAASKESMFHALDNAKFSRFHVKAILISGVGFFTYAYDLFIINLVVPMIAYAYFGGHMPVLEETFLKGSATVGTFIGQLSFGILGDLLGRKKNLRIRIVYDDFGNIWMLHCW